jgi:8-oxo-dGTP diphosphatase
LPKGKPDRGEKIRQTALREVKEETGCKVKPKKGSKLTTKYATRRGNRKVVKFFRMRFVKRVGRPDPYEIEKVKWLSPAAAVKRLTYRSERTIVRKMYPEVATK